jgi:hypothetical protein
MKLGTLVQHTNNSPPHSFGIIIANYQTKPLTLKKEWVSVLWYNIKTNRWHIPFVEDLKHLKEFIK